MSTSHILQVMYHGSRHEDTSVRRPWTNRGPQEGPTCDLSTSSQILGPFRRRAHLHARDPG